MHLLLILAKKLGEALENGTLERAHFAASSDMLDLRNEVTDGWEDGASGCQSPCLCKETCWGVLRNLPLVPNIPLMTVVTFPVAVL